MSQTEINSLFTAGGIPASGLVPTVRIWEVDGTLQTLIVGSPSGTGQNTDGIMSEIETGSPVVQDGFYTFLFTNLIGYDQTKKYLIRTDGGASLPDADRYQVAEIVPNTLDNQLTPNHIIPGSAGYTLSQIKADTTQLFLDIAAIDDLVTLLLKFDTNRTKIDETAKTLTVYDDDCLTVLRVFQLLDQGGAPSTTSVCERKPIAGGTDGKAVCP